MIISIGEEETKILFKHQLTNIFGLTEIEKMLIDVKWGGVIEKLDYCFSRNNNKYYNRDGITYFNPYHSGQYSIFLYFMSRAVFLSGENNLLADKIYYLNKVLNGCDLFYEVQLPDYFQLDHPVGSVMGRAIYGEGFSFGQCCTVGNNRGVYPILGKNVRMCANSSIIGNCRVGNNVIIGANSGIKDCNVPNNTIVFGQSPNNIFKHRKV